MHTIVHKPESVTECIGGRTMNPEALSRLHGTKITAADPRTGGPVIGETDYFSSETAT